MEYYREYAWLKMPLDRPATPPTRDRVLPSCGRASPVEGAGNAPAAQAVLNYLFSTDGEALLNAKGFLPGPLLFSGDVTAVPEKLRRYIEGVFTQTVLAVTPPTPAVAGTVTTLTATVTPAAAGSVQFTDGDTPLGNPVTVTNGTASMTTRPEPSNSKTAPPRWASPYR